MKLYFYLGILLLAAPLYAAAQEQVSQSLCWTPGIRYLPDYFYMAENVYVAQVTAVHGKDREFTVTETLRGKPGEKFQLHISDGKCDFVNPDHSGHLRTYDKGSEWLLANVGPGYVTSPYAKDTAGWMKLGVHGWLPTPIIRSGKVAYVQDFRHDGHGTGFKDKAADGTTGVTLEHVKALLVDHPYKPKS